MYPKVPDLEEIIVLLVSKLLSWTGKKPRERMLLSLEHALQYLKYASDSSRAFIVRNYFKLHILGIYYSIFGFSTITVSLFYLGANWLVAIITIIPIIAPLLTEFLWRNIADKNPRDYLKGIRAKIPWLFQISWFNYTWLFSFNIFTLFISFHKKCRV